MSGQSSGAADGSTGARSLHGDLPDHRDEAAVRDELTRVLTECASCRRCTDLCSSFPTLFDLLDGAGSDDPGLLTPLEQDRIVDGCHGCDRCTVECPYAPGRDGSSVDVASIMTVAKAMQRSAGHRSSRDRLADRVLRPDGRTGRVVSLVTNGGRRAWTRAVVGPIGVTPVGVPRRRTTQRFSTWFRDREPSVAGGRRVVLLASCVVEHGDPGLGVDIVEVLESVGATVELAAGSCCGAHWLRSGDLERFVATAGEFAGRAGEQLGDGLTELVVGHPTCLHAIVEQAPRFVGEPHRTAVVGLAERTRGVAEFVLGEVNGPMGWDPGAPSAGGEPLRLVFAASCHGRTTGGTEAIAELMRRAGAEVEVVAGCAGVGGPWGAHASTAASADEFGARADRRIGAALQGVDPVVVGDCPDANAAVARRTGVEPVHPWALLAEALRAGAVPTRRPQA